MPTYSAPDDTRLAYHVFGEGPPLICLPGGPMQSSDYLGELGGLSAHRQLIMLDPRGTGGSAVPGDPASYRCDRLVEDIDALRGHLGLDRMDLLGHSSGVNLAALYVARHPERVGRLALITPSVWAVGIPIPGEVRRKTVRARHAEPWFPAAYAALEAITEGRATADTWQAITPFSYGRWDEEAQAFESAGEAQRNDEAAGVFAGEGAFDPDATRAALGRFEGPVLLLAGEVDPGAPPVTVTEFAGLFPNAELVVQPGAGHFPWRDDPDRFVAATAEFLA
ncbi:alpha/beta fold hydrolase [Streptomyces sp. NPDC057137]|uniref:alpha/beta fold hydrolase n=1 Tax=Streptomyces sp. NPDC057137 TaxID=3346030 RepID=UPI0036303D77